MLAPESESQSQSLVMSRDQTGQGYERFEKAKVLVGKRYVSEAGAAIRSSSRYVCTVRETGPGPYGLATEEFAQGLSGGGRRAIRAQLLYDRSSPGLGWIVELAVLLAWTKRYLTSRCRDVVVLVPCWLLLVTAADGVAGWVTG